MHDKTERIILPNTNRQAIARTCSQYKARPHLQTGRKKNRVKNEQKNGVWKAGR